jgi:fructose 5-dehydrogenase small subunit
LPGPVKSHQNKLTSLLLNRRSLLLVLGGGIAALSILPWLRQPASPEKKPTPDIAPALTTQLNNFFSLSKQLIAHHQLDPQTSAHIYRALSDQNPEFQRHAAKLVQLVQERNLNDPDAILNFLNKESMPLKAVMQQIVEAWYLGRVGNQLIVYESACMFNPVREVIGVPSYCYAAYGYWAAKPKQG